MLEIACTDEVIFTFFLSQVVRFPGVLIFKDFGFMLRNIFSFLISFIFPMNQYNYI